MIYELNPKEVKALRKVIDHIISNEQDFVKKTPVFKAALTLANISFMLEMRKGLKP